ncbi:hypothetical protein CRYUN_Cryun39dG0068000 [Craigia yunnanensis]
MALRTWMNSKSNALASMLPPGPPKLPLIGNLHLFIGTQPPRCLARLAQKYGPVMLLQLGKVSTVVISSAEAAKEVMKTHYSIFSERPCLYAAEYITYNFQDIVFSHKDYWRQIRKICALELFSQKRVQSFRPIRKEEVSNLVRTISLKAGLPINLKDYLYSLTLNIISRTAFGGKCKHQNALKKLLPDIVALFGGLSVVDVYPSIKLLHISIAAKLTTTQENEVDDLVHVLDIQDHGELEVPLSTYSIKAILMNLFIAGTDPPSMVIEWAMSELLRNPEIMKKVQSEVRHVFAGSTDVNELGIPDLMVIVNSWAIGRNPKYWTEAEKFYPARFLDSSISYKGTDFEYIPFGSGRRICPGMSFGIAMVELILANLLYHFDWKLPNGKKPQDLVDMTEIFNASLLRKYGLYLVPIPYNYMTSE